MMKKGVIVGVAAAVVICAAVIPRFMNNKQFAEAVALPVMETASPDRRYPAYHKFNRKGGAFGCGLHLS